VQGQKHGKGDEKYFGACPCRRARGALYLPERGYAYGCIYLFNASDIIMYANLWINTGKRESTGMTAGLCVVIFEVAEVK